MNTNIGLGPAIPFGSASPRARTAVEVHGDNRRNKADRPRMAPTPDDEKPVLDENQILGAPMRGPLPGPMRTPLEAAAVEARQARTAGTAPANESRDMSQVLTMLEAILARLDALEARVTIIDGNATGEAA
jgi:hypothetical protein